MSLYLLEFIVYHYIESELTYTPDMALVEAESFDDAIFKVKEAKGKQYGVKFEHVGNFQNKTVGIIIN